MTKPGKKSLTSAGHEAGSVAREFSRTVEAANLPSGGREISVKADSNELAALTRRFGLLALTQLQGAVRLTPFGGKNGEGRGIEVSGRFEAQVQQPCVVTLDPVDAALVETFTVRYVPEEVLSENLGPDGELVIEDANEESLEPLEGALEDGKVDIGEMVAQHLALALDPYPRKSGAGLVADDDAQAQEKRENPFAALAKLKGDL